MSGTSRPPRVIYHDVNPNPTKAHYDGVGSGSTRREAADDNGSGSVVLLEALRVLAAANFKPKQTLELHFYAGEEAGLLGSRDVFASYRSRGARVVAYLNQVIKKKLIKRKIERREVNFDI